MSHRRVTVHAGVVLKRYSADVGIEYAKAERLWEISKTTGFVAPRPLSIDHERSVVTYELIEQMVSVREAYLAHVQGRSSNDSLARGVFRGVGEALAEIHARLSLRTRTQWQPSGIFLNAMSELGAEDFGAQHAGFLSSYLHGDYGFSNVHYLPTGNNTIAVIDCSSDNFTNFSSDTFGPSYLDLGHMVACIDGLVPLHNHFFIHWERTRELKEEFLRAYERRRGLSVDRGWIARFAYASVVAKFGRSLKWRWLRKLTVAFVFNSLKGNLPGTINEHERQL